MLRTAHKWCACAYRQEVGTEHIRTDEPIGIKDVYVNISYSYKFVLILFILQMIVTEKREKV